MKLGEVVFYLVIIIACSIYLITALTAMTVGSFASPGPGFLPSLIAMFSIVLAGILFVKSLRELLKDKKTNSRALIPSFIYDKESGKKWLKVLMFCICIIIYLLLFKIVNFFISTFVLMFILGKLFGMKGWLKPLLMALIFVIAVYFIFIVGFKMHI